MLFISLTWLCNMVMLIESEPASLLLLMVVRFDRLSRQLITRLGANSRLTFYTKISHAAIYVRIKWKRSSDLLFYSILLGRQRLMIYRRERDRSAKSVKPYYDERQPAQCDQLAAPWKGVNAPPPRHCKGLRQNINIPGPCGGMASHSCHSCQIIGSKLAAKLILNRKVSRIYFNTRVLFLFRKAVVYN